MTLAGKGGLTAFVCEIPPAATADQTIMSDFLQFTGNVVDIERLKVHDQQLHVLSIAFRQAPSAQLCLPSGSAARQVL